MSLVLASSSPRRSVLLSLLTDSFEVDAPDVDERLPDGPIESALETVAARKAAACNGAVVLAADTIVGVEGRVRGKPTDQGEAKQMLESLGNHCVVTAVAVRTAAGTETGHCVTHIRCGGLPPDVVAAYLASGAWHGKAGAYGIQDAPIAPFLELDGPWSNVVGLPLALTASMLERAGIAVRETPDESALRAHNPF